MEKIKMYQLAIDTYNLIKKYVESGEDYSLIMNTYNSLINEHNLDLPRIIWKDISNFELWERGKEI